MLGTSLQLTSWAWVRLMSDALRPTMGSLRSTAKLTKGLSWLTGVLPMRVMVRVGAVLSTVTATDSRAVLPAVSVLMRVTL